MTDVTRKNLNSQKRGVCVGVYPLTSALVTSGADLAYLPPRSVVISARAVVKTPSDNATGNIVASVAGTAVTGNIVVGSAVSSIGSITSAAAYQETGGLISVAAGSVAPTGTDLDAELVIEYIELDKTTGEYTRVTQA